MSHSLILLEFTAIILVSSILVFQDHIRTPIVLASESSVYSSGFEQGCNEARMSDPSKRFINQPERIQLFTTDEFTRGYTAGYDICSKNLGLNFLGWSIKPELSIGDTAAIAALIASALIFWFGYRRTRKSEQIKIARDLMDRINMKKHKLDEYRQRNLSSVIEGDDGSFRKADISNEQAEVFTRHLLELLSEIEYFVDLVDNHELEDRKLLRYYRPKVMEVYFHSRTIFDEERLRLQKYYGQTDRLSAYFNKILFSSYIGGKGVEGIVEALESFFPQEKNRGWRILAGIFYPFYHFRTQIKKFFKKSISD